VRRNERGAYAYGRYSRQRRRQAAAGRREQAAGGRENPAENLFQWWQNAEPGRHKTQAVKTAEKIERQYGGRQQAVVKRQRIAAGTAGEKRICSETAEKRQAAAGRQAAGSTHHPVWQQNRRVRAHKVERC